MEKENERLFFIMMFIVIAVGMIGMGYLIRADLKERHEIVRACLDKGASPMECRLLGEK